MRRKREYRTASKDCYHQFCEKHPEIKISFLKWKKVIYTCNEMFIDYALESGDKVKLPWGFSYLTINKDKKRTTFLDNKGERKINLPVDWQASKKEGKRIYIMNYHSEGYRYQWKWFSKEARLHLSSCWTFKPYRLVSRKLASYIKKPNTEYKHIYKEWKF